MAEMKRCGRCKKDLPIAEFSKTALRQGERYYQSYCRRCMREYSVEHRCVATGGRGRIRRPKLSAEDKALILSPVRSW